jgi:arginase
VEVDLLQVPFDSGPRGVRMGAGSLGLVESGLVDHLAGLGHHVRLVPVEHESEFPTEIAAAFELARKIRDRVTESREEGR